MQAQPDPPTPEPPTPEVVPRWEPPAAPRATVVEGSLLAVIRRVARAWWLILLVTVVATAGAYWWMTITQPLYTARTIVTAAESSGDKLGGALSSFSFGASQLGIELPQPSSAPAFTEFLEILTSQTLAERLEERHGVMRTVFASRWDAETGTWLPPGSLMGRLQVRLRSLVGQQPWAEPTPAALADYLARELSVNDPLGTGMYLIEISDEDRAFAQELLGWVLREADNIMKERTIARSQEQIAYLKEKLEETALREQRTALIGLLVIEERDVLLASSELPFAAKFVDAVRVTDLPTFPEPFKVFAITILGGIALTVLGVLVVDIVRYA